MHIMPLKVLNLNKCHLNTPTSSLLPVLTFFAHSHSFKNLVSSPIFLRNHFRHKKLKIYRHRTHTIPYEAIIWLSLHPYHTVSKLSCCFIVMVTGTPVTVLAPYSIWPYAIYGTVLSPSLYTLHPAFRKYSHFFFI
jgi:hypothetical protein